MPCPNKLKLNNSIDLFFSGSINKKFKEFKDSDKKIDFTVDQVWDLGMNTLDTAATPVKYIFSSMGVDINKKTNWFKVTEVQKMSSDLINDYRNLKAGVYDGAADIKNYLSTLDKEDSKALVHALGGDLDKEELNIKLQPLYERFRSVIDQNANELVSLGVLSEETKIKDYLKRYYAQYIETEKHGSSLAFAKLHKRKDLSLDERIALGMMEDADFVIPHTIAEQNILIQKAKLLQKIADTFGVDEEKAGYVKMPETTLTGGLKKYGALSGKYVPKDVKNEIDAARVIETEKKVLEDGLYPIIDHLKVNLTVKNPATHVYNIASNVLLAGLNGDLAAVGKVLYLRAKKPKQFKKLLAQANKHGLNSYLDDFENAHVDLKPDGKTVNVAASIYKNLYMTQDSKLGAGVRKLYDWEDKIFKLAAFKKHLDQGMEEKTAFKEAVEVYVDYSTPLPTAVRFLDKSGLMPFLHYQYKSTPAVAKVMLKNPFRSMLFGTGAAALGLTAFQNEDEELKTPTWANDKINLFAIGEWSDLGNGWYLNSGRMIPATKFEFELGGIVKSTIDVINGKTPLGYNINSKYDNSMEKYSKRALVMAENYLPSLTLGRYAQRAINIELGKLGFTEPKQNYYKEDMTYEELFYRAFGVRRFNEEKEILKRLREATNEKNYKLKQKLKKGDKKEILDNYNTTVRKIRAVKSSNSSSTQNTLDFEKYFDF